MRASRGSGASKVEHSWGSSDRPKPVLAKRESIELLEEHIASRKEWSAYVELVTKVHRNVASEADQFLTDLRTRIELALRGAGEPPQSC
jgi:hypothetical protein